MKQLKLGKFGAVLAIWMLSASVMAQRAIIFTTAPTQKLNETRKHYQPIVDYLSKKIGQPIKLSVADNFIEYSENILEDKYDIVFDGPHYVGWRIKKRNHTALVKFPGQLRYVVVVHENSGIKSIGKLAGKPVCGLGSPNMLTLGFLEEFSNQASLPLITNEKSFKGVLQCLQKKEGIAGIFRDKYWAKRPAAVKRGFKVLFYTKVAWPDRGVSVSKRVNPKTRQLIRDALLNEQVKMPGASLFKKFRVPGFVSANDEEYRELGKLLRSIWGFHE